MSCTEMKPLIEGYFDQELDLVRSLEIEKHLETCSACANQLKHLEGLRMTLSSAHLQEQAPTRLRDWAEALAAKTENRPKTWNLDFFRGWAPAGIVAFASVAFLIGTPLVSRSRAETRQADEIVSAHVRSLMAAHLTDVVSTDQHTVKPWFNGKLDFAPWVHDLTEYEFPLKGGRLDYIARRPAAALVYQRHQHIINLFLWPVPEDRDRAQAALVRRGYNVIHWTKAGMTYWVVSDLNRQELQQFAQLVQNQTLFP